MNVLPRDTQVAIIKALVEGMSIRSVERMTGVHRDTVMRLMVKIGEGCERLQDRIMRDLDGAAFEVDEIWGYVGKKQRQMTDTDDEAKMGDQWTFVAIDADTKLIPCFTTGKRDAETAQKFTDAALARRAGPTRRIRPRPRNVPRRDRLGGRRGGLRPGRPRLAPCLRLGA